MTIISKDQEIEAIEDWFASKHCTLWGVFDIVQPDTKRAAAEWFSKEIKSLLAFMETG